MTHPAGNASHAAYLRMSHQRACPLSPSTVLQILSMATSLPVSGDSPTSREKVDPCQYLRRNDTPAASRPGTAGAEDGLKKRDFEEVEGDCCAALTAAIPWGIHVGHALAVRSLTARPREDAAFGPTGLTTDGGASTKKRQKESGQRECSRCRSLGRGRVTWGNKPNPKHRKGSARVCMLACWKRRSGQARGGKSSCGEGGVDEERAEQGPGNE